MSSDRERRGRATRRVKPGDGHQLKPYRWWQPFSRALFHLRLRNEIGEIETWSVSVGFWGDDNGETIAQLYRDGRNQASSKLPAAFAVPGGTVEVVASTYGLRRCHYVDRAGNQRQLTPDPASAEGRRARLQRSHPALSRAIGVVSVLVLLVALVLGVPQLVETITQIPPVAENVGTFESPIRLPAWFNIGLVVAAMLASVERALRLRFNWLLDGGIFDGEE